MPDIQPAATPPLTAASAATPSPATTALSALQVEIADLSQALQDLGRAIQTNATVTAPPTNNTLTLATALGNITVDLPQLATVAEQQNLNQLLTSLAQSQRPLTLGLQAGSPPTQAVLLLPTATPAPVNAPSQVTTPAPLLPLPLAPQPLAPGTTLPALVLPSNIALPQTGLPTQQPTLPPTATPPITAPPVTTTTPTSLTPPAPATTIPATTPASILAQPAEQTTNTPPIATPATSVPTTPPATPNTTTAATPSPILPAPAANLATLLQPGNEVALHIDAVLPPNTPPTALPPLASNQIAATVTGTGTDGQLILKAGDSTLFVKAPATAQIGATVIVTVDAAKPLPPVTFPALEPINFPALPQALAALAQADPQAMMQMMAMRIPQPNAALPGAMLLLLGAFKQGDARPWLGDNATESLLRLGKTELIQSLSRELAGAGQPVQDNVVGEWHSYPIPLYHQAQFQALTLYVHNERQGRGDNANTPQGANKVRFLIDMRLSKLGAMQIDGFVQQKKLDMILRSETLLPTGMHNDLRGAYIKAIGAVGYTGSLLFQVGRQNWMTMQRPTGPAIVT